MLLPSTTRDRAAPDSSDSYDVMHFGHANLLRQARELGGCLVAGVHSDGVSCSFVCDDDDDVSPALTLCSFALHSSLLYCRGASQAQGPDGHELRRAVRRQQQA